MWEGKLKKRREGEAIKNPEERPWSDRDNIRNRSVSTDSPSFSLAYLPSLPSGSGSDAVRPNYSPPLSFLLHLPTCPPGFIHLLIFQTLPPFFQFPHHFLPPYCSGSPASPSRAVNIKEALSWNPADSCPANCFLGAWLCAAKGKQPHQGQAEYCVP